MHEDRGLFPYRSFEARFKPGFEIQDSGLSALNFCFNRSNATGHENDSNGLYLFLM